MFEVTARHTTNSNISNYVSTKKVFRIIVMSTETVEPTRSIHKVGRNTIKETGNEGQDRPEDNVTTQYNVASINYQLCQ